MIINVEKIEPAASCFANQYAAKLIAETRGTAKDNMMVRMIPPSAWEALQAEIAARAKQCFLEGAEMACSIGLCPLREPDAPR